MLVGLIMSTFYSLDVQGQNIGINDDGSVPGAFLHVNYTTSIDAQVELMRLERYVSDITSPGEGGYIGMYLKDSDNGGVEVSRIGFKSGGDGTISNEDEGQLSFFTSDNTGTLQERMVVKSSGKVGIGTDTPQGTLDVSGTTGGVVFPRLTSTEKSAITSPVAGTMIYQTNGDVGLYYYDGTNWIRLMGTPNDTIRVTLPILNTTTALSSGGNIYGNSFYTIPPCYNGYKLCRLTYQVFTTGAVNVSCNVNIQKAAGGGVNLSSSTLTAGAWSVSESLIFRTMYTGDRIRAANASFVGVAPQGYTITFCLVKP